MDHDFDLVNLSQFLRNGTIRVYLPPDVVPFAFGRFVCAIMTIGTASIGILGNGMVGYIFARSPVTNSVNVLLTGQALVDCALLLLATPLFASLGIHAYYSSPTLIRVILYLTLWIYPLAMAAQTATVWTMVTITCERYLAVCHPFKARVLCTVSSARKALGVIVGVSLVYNACRYWEYQLTSDEADLAPILRNNSTYVQVYYNWLYFVTMFLVPFTVLLALNTIIVRAIRRARSERQRLSAQKNREHRTAMMMVIITFLFLSCNSLAFVLNIVDAANLEYCQLDRNIADACITHQPFFMFLIDVNNFLVEANSSVPFLIFFTFSKEFRTNFRKQRRNSLRKVSNVFTYKYSTVIDKTCLDVSV